ncbi:helix-turn-helix domain-containing protein [Alkalicoccobacillus porphyridii]|uniref:Response regulator n=1 Tax=Alkalicoccobacillus porphyridii TaxID=2597270 RepID=A0A553ZYT7_9BACI|nr:helix-turn-helix domain-containing protein [Alkalicoccobacillus porphyridii]TSB46609.1 response regulator [Alkalicoccobacillus porphyridii]
MYTLLLVDDEEATLLGLSAIAWDKLNISTILLASSVTEALTQLESNSVHVVITDIRMPGQTGIDLLIEMERRGHVAKGLLLSGYAEFEYAKQAIHAHAVDYLLKPCSDEEVLNAVERAIEAVQEDERIRAEKLNMVTHLGKKPLMVGELLLQKWLTSYHTVDMIQKQIEEYQLPFRSDAPSIWIGIYSEKLNDKMMIESEVLTMFSSISFPMLISDKPDFLYILLVSKESTPEDWIHTVLTKLIPQFKQHITVKLHAAFFLEVSNPFLFWPHVKHELDDLHQTIHASKQFGNKPAAEILVDRAKQYVNNHLDIFPTLQSAADYLHVHSAYLSKVYKEVSGENFTEYTHRLKMEHAVHLLVHTNQRILQIAEQLGYNDSSYFIKVFKKYFNKTPHEFRNR